MIRTSSRTMALLFLGLIAASLANAARPKPLPWVLDFGADIFDNPDAEAKLLISFDDVREHLLNASAIFIDARKPDAYAEGHLEGAYNVPSDDIESFMDALYMNVSNDALLIVYCDGGNCEASHQVADFLKQSGFGGVKIFKDGWEVLGESDLAIVYGSEPYGGDLDPTEQAYDVTYEQAGQPDSLGTEQH
ncbi:MAG: rhodanese-like domain-containing protein [Phycisphaerae bacterium]